MVLLDLFQVLIKVDLVRCIELCPLEKLPREVEDGADANHGISRRQWSAVSVLPSPSRDQNPREQELGDVPLPWQKHCVPSHKGHDESPGEAKVSGIGHEHSLVREGIA